MDGFHPMVHKFLKFENKFAKCIGKKYCISVSSGSAALDIAIKCLNLKKNDEVIIPKFYYVQITLAVLRQGLNQFL